MTDIPNNPAPFGKRMTAVAVSTVVFLAATYICCYAIWMLLSRTLWTTETFPDGPPQSFIVVAEKASANKSKGQDFIFYYWSDLNSIKDNPQYTFHLPEREWSGNAGGNSASFKVIEDTPAYQIVEAYQVSTVAIKTRYRVEGGRITPLYLRTDGGPFAALLIFIFASWVCLKLSRLAHKKVLSS